jgi:predicted cobalt transporter CbtA
MRIFLKPFVLWLLLIAVPFQGYAASAMMCCGSAHAKDASHAAQSEKHDHAHSAVSGLDHDHESALGAAGTTATEQDSAHHHPGDGSKRAAFKCSACASCCVGAVLLQTPNFSFDVAPLQSMRIAFVPRYFYRFVPETLERPPYRLIA